MMNVLSLQCTGCTSAVGHGSPLRSPGVWRSIATLCSAQAAHGSNHRGIAVAQRRQRRDSDALRQRSSSERDEQLQPGHFVRRDSFSFAAASSAACDAAVWSLPLFISSACLAALALMSSASPDSRAASRACA